jgi:hypothetical protein
MRSENAPDGPRLAGLTSASRRDHDRGRGETEATTSLSCRGERRGRGKATIKLGAEPNAAGPRE